ncbi:MAG: hypothetical protein ACAH95_08265 [Fimbriimonas sp.]
MRWPLLLAAMACLGCQTGTLIDPTEANSDMSPEILRDNLKSISDSLIQRRIKGEITGEQYRELIAKAAAELVEEMDLEHVEPGEAWQYGEVLRAARNWEVAEKLLQIAVEHAKTKKSEDRRVNDTLRLAQVQASLGKVQAGIRTASEVLDAKPSDSAPILLAVLYEIVPAARGREHDAELAELLEASIQKHLGATVETSTQEGQAFMAARQHHVSGAYVQLANLYDAAGMSSAAAEAREKARLSSSDFTEFLRAELAKPVTKRL